MSSGTEFKKFELLPLPYTLNALEPNISQTQMEFHYGKHHAGYVNGLNEIVEKDPHMQGKSLEELIRTLPEGKALNFACQAWNHTFYWNSMGPKGGGSPTGTILEAINRSFGGFDKMKKEFNEQGSSHFGSGWTWLVMARDGSLRIMTTHDAGNPIRTGEFKPILNLDVWEHAYYLDWKHDRKTYMDHWWNLVNWEFANRCLTADCVSHSGPCTATSHASPTTGTTCRT